MEVRVRTIDAMGHATTTFLLVIVGLRCTFCVLPYPITFNGRGRTPRAALITLPTASPTGEPVRMHPWFFTVKQHNIQKKIWKSLVIHTSSTKEVHTKLISYYMPTIVVRQCRPLKASKQNDNLGRRKAKCKFINYVSAIGYWPSCSLHVALI